MISISFSKWPALNKNPAQEINSKSLWLFYGLDIFVLPYGNLITHIPLPLQKME
jgi:hypothetical protein